MKKTAMLACLLVAAYAGPGPVAGAEMRKWVAADGLRRHTCPSEDCGVTGRFFFRESLFVYETRGGWSRVTHYRSAGCYNGRSVYVESGSAECSAANGIVHGEYAEWVRSEFLAGQRPDEPLAVQG